MTTQPQTCSQCGFEFASTEAVAGMCPRCVISRLTDQPQDSERHSADHDANGSRFDVPSVEDLQPHFDKYEIIDVIGHGGMSAVYRAKQNNVGRVVALKILPREIAESSDGSDRFTREIIVMGRLNHPNIVSLYDAGEAGPWCFCVMEFVQGPNLRQLMGEDRFTTAEILRLVPDICDGLQFAHDSGVVHRDIKPENILVDSFGRAKIADFGLAKLLRSEEASNPITAAQQVFGTPRYMAPEQHDSPTDVDHRADLYSLGIVLYEMLVGTVPSAGCDPPSNATADKTAKRLDSIVLKTLAGDRRQRYQAARDLRQDLLTAFSIDEPRQSRDTRSFWWTEFVVPTAAIGMLILAVSFMLESREAYFKSVREAAAGDPLNSAITMQRGWTVAAMGLLSLLGSFAVSKANTSGIRSWADASAFQQLTAPIVYLGNAVLGLFVRDNSGTDHDGVGGCSDGDE